MKNTENTKKYSSEILEKFTSHLYISEKILKYSLYLQKALNLQVADYKNNFPGCIEKIITEIANDCTNFTNNYDFNFFGYKEKDINDMSILCECGTFWTHAFKQDAVISAFVKLRKVICESYCMSPVKRIRISNYTLKKEEHFDKCHHGFDYLSMNNKIILNTNTDNSSISISINKNKEGLNSTILCENAQNHIRRIKSLDKKFKQAGLSTLPLYLLLNDNPNKKSEPEQKPESLLSVLEFYDFLVRRSPSRYKEKTIQNIKNNDSILPILDAYITGKPFTPFKYKEYINCLNKLLSSIEATEIDNGSVAYNPCDNEDSCFPPHRLALSDKIYLRYQIEKVFAPSAINCLYQNILPTKGEVYALNEQDSVNLLASFLKLPNVFTRQYILQMAVDVISQHYDYNFKDSDFFTKKMDLTDAIMTFASTKYNHLNNFYKMDTWKSRYRNTINYLSKILFPVFENYFFCALWNIIKNANKNYTDAQIIVEMYILLRDYLNDSTNVKELFATDEIIVKYHSRFKTKNNKFIVKHHPSSKTKNNKFIVKHHPSSKTKNNKFIARRYYSLKKKNINIIHPSFKYDEKATIDTTLYKNCLTANSLTYKNLLIPDFITYGYLEEIIGEHQTYIQNLYIIESAIYKR